MGGKDLRRSTGTQNIGGDQEEDGAPARRPEGTGGLSPLEIGDGGSVVVSGHNRSVVHDRIDFMYMALGESVLDDAAERPRVLSVDRVPLVGTLFGTCNLRIVEVLLEQDGRIVVDLSLLNGKAVTAHILVMTMFERVLVWVLLAKARVTAIEGEVG